MFAARRFLQVNLKNPKIQAEELAKQKLGILNGNFISVRARTSRLLNISLNKTMTQTQKTTPGVKESKAKSFLVNILTLKSDPIVLYFRDKAFALLLTSKATIASMLPRPGIKGSSEKGEEVEGADTWQPQERGNSYQG
jgi:hypothetical protein